MRIVIDTSILGQLCYPKKNKALAEWFAEKVRSRNDDFFVPEIADYELRRGLIKLIAQKQASAKALDHLDSLSKALEFVPITTAIMRRAAELWAKARIAGHVTAPEKSLDGDVILASQVIEVAGTVWTANERHLRFFVPTATTNGLMGV